MRRIHPFVYGHVVAALIVGASTGATLDAQAAAMGAGMLFAVFRLTLPPILMQARRLLGEASIPLMLLALGFMAVDYECVVGTKKGWNCLGMAIAIVVAGVCLLPPFGGWLWRWWKRRRPAPEPT